MQKRTRPFSTQSRICFSRSESAAPPVFTSINKISFIGMPSAAPQNATKSTGFPINRASHGLHGKPGKNGASCSPASPPKTARERFKASARSEEIRSLNFVLVSRLAMSFPRKKNEIAIMKKSASKKNAPCSCNKIAKTFFKELSCMLLLYMRFFYNATARMCRCASRASGDINNFRSCKRRGAAYAQAARAARWIVSAHANDAERRMRKPRERRDG